MSQLPFYSYLFADEVLFKLPADGLPREEPQPLEKPQSPESRLPRQPEAPVPAAAPSAPAPLAPVPVASPPVASPFAALKTRVLILVNTYGKGIKPEEREFLGKVLKAVQHDFEKVDLLESDKIGLTDASALLAGGLADYVMLFGIKPESVNLDIDLALYIPKNVNGTWFLLSNSLLRIEMEESKRRELWQALKKMFLGGH